MNKQIFNILLFRGSDPMCRALLGKSMNSEIINTTPPPPPPPPPALAGSTNPA